MPQPWSYASLFLDSRIGSVVEKERAERRAVFIHVPVLRQRHVEILRRIPSAQAARSIGSFDGCFRERPQKGGQIHVKIFSFLLDSRIGRVVKTGKKEAGKVFICVLSPVSGT